MISNFLGHTNVLCRWPDDIFLNGWRDFLLFESSLQWRHNDQDGVSNHQPHGCLLNRLFRRRSKKTSKLRVTGLCEGNSPVPVNSPHKGPVTRKMFPFDDVIMYMLFYDWYFYDMCTDNGIARVEYTPFLIIVWQDDMVIGRRPICKMFIFVLNILTSISQKILPLSVSQYAVSVIYSRHVMTWKRLRITGPLWGGSTERWIPLTMNLFLVVGT